MTVLSPADHEGLLEGHIRKCSWMCSVGQSIAERERERENRQVDFLASPWISDLNLGPFSLC